MPLQSRVDTVNGILAIQSVNQSDAGMYQCLAENKYGAIYASAELKILGMQFFWQIKKKDIWLSSPLFQLC
jgi:hypothetical protein